jgi:hypothetical protein
LGVFSEEFLNGVQFEIPTHKDLLEPSILVLEILQPASFASFKPLVLVPPSKKAGWGDTVDAADLFDRSSRNFRRLQDLDDLFIRPLLAPQSILLRRRTLP